MLRSIIYHLTTCVNWVLAWAQITWEDLQAAEKAVGAFGGDNRAGVQGTLHRISALRNRKGTVVGLTCRVGRAVTGHMALISDLMEGASLLYSSPFPHHCTVPLLPSHCNHAHNRRFAYVRCDHRQFLNCKTV